MKNMLMPLIAFSLIGCASVQIESVQKIEIVSKPGVSCTAKNLLGTWTVVGSGSFAAYRDNSPLDVTCSNGFTQRINYTSSKETKGNVMWGGLVGFAVDAAKGTAYEYPVTVIDTTKY